MKCTKCGKENPSEALFCIKCGEKLEKKCPACGANNPLEALHCMKCGAKFPELILNIEEKYVGENRPVTVLFADISDSTQISYKKAIDGKTSEAIYHLAYEWLESMSDIVVSYGGSPYRFEGDCMLALFGTPEMHENDAERAILAAIDMQERLRRQKYELHAGIATALMTIGDMKTQLYSDRSPHSLNVVLARRLQGVAKRGQILVCRETYRLTNLSFHFNTLQNLSLKDFPNEIAYEFLRAKVHSEKSRGMGGLRVGLIGRKREMEDLKESTDRLMAGEGQIVSIIGDPGVGKSRLVEELISYIDSKKTSHNKANGLLHSNPTVLHLKGRSVDIGKSTAYRVFIDILKYYFEFAEDDSQKEMADKILAKIKQLFPDRWEDVVPYIGNLLSVKFGNEWDDRVKYVPPEHVRFQTDQIRHRTALILKDIFISLTKQNPLLLIFEDIHWADNPSLDLISMLMDEIINLPIMLLCIYQPTGKGSKSWQIGIKAGVKYPDRYKEIILRGLLPQESRLMLESMLALLNIGNFPEKITSIILKNTEGNPLFIEAVVHFLIDNQFIYKEEGRWIVREDIEEIEVPDIQRVIMYRIGHLEKNPLNILQCASVIGRSFQSELLAYMIPDITHKELLDYLQNLEEKDIIYTERDIPELEYSFKGEQYKKTIYQNMLSTHRQILHQKAGDGIEHLYQNRIEEFYEELFEHYSQGENITKAIDYSIRSGSKAKTRYDHQAAIQYFEKALNYIHSQSPAEIPQEITVLENLGDVLFMTGIHQKSYIYIERALKLSHKLQDKHIIATLSCKLADLKHWQQDFNKAIEIAKSGLDALDGQSHNHETVSLLEVIIRSYRAKGDFDLARSYADQNAQIIHKISFYHSIYKAYYELAFLEMDTGNLDKAMIWLKEMKQICEENKDEIGLARFYHGMADLCWIRDDFIQAKQWLEESLRYCEKVGEAHLLMEGHLELAHHLIILDEDSNKIQVHITQGLELAEQMAKTSKLASVCSLCKSLRDAYYKKGDMDKSAFYNKRAMEFEGGEPG